VYEERRCAAAELAGAVLWIRPPPQQRATAPAKPFRVLPDGCMDLLWNDGTLLVAGPDTTAYVSATGSAGHWAGVRFAPGAAPAALGVPAHELRDRRVPLTGLWGDGRARRAAERIDAAPDPAAALEALAGSLAGAARAAGRPPDPLGAVVLRAVRQGVPVRELARATALSERQVRRRCLDLFGYGPRTLGRVLRLRRALALAAAGTPFAETAALAGYADQPHLAREVRALTGTRLSTLLAERTPGAG
jgi:AraC-like DNA-binding protein